MLGADGLMYQNLEDLLAVGKEMNPTVTEFDASCFDGKYVTGDIDEAYLQRLEDSGRGSGRNRSGQKMPGMAPAATAAPAPATPPKPTPPKAVSV